jgi:hypothetical protein
MTMVKVMGSALGSTLMAVTCAWRSPLPGVMLKSTALL